MASETTVGRFIIGPRGEITGPADYLASESYQRCKGQIEAGTHVLIGTAPLGTPIPVLLGLILQTDYAAWLGTKQLLTFKK